jgi:hypothetical protein
MDMAYSLDATMEEQLCHQKAVALEQETKLNKEIKMAVMRAQDLSEQLSQIKKSNEAEKTELISQFTREREDAASKLRAFLKQLYDVVGFNSDSMDEDPSSSQIVAFIRQTLDEAREGVRKLEGTQAEIMEAFQQKRLALDQSNQMCHNLSQTIARLEQENERLAEVHKT